MLKNQVDGKGCVQNESRRIISKSQGNDKRRQLRRRKTIYRRHKEQLGPYKEKAQNLLKDVNIDSVKDKFKNLFNK